jgi:hypothetical protein
MKCRNLFILIVFNIVNFYKNLTPAHGLLAKIVECRRNRHAREPAITFFKDSRKKLESPWN